MDNVASRFLVRLLSVSGGSRIHFVIRHARVEEVRWRPYCRAKGAIRHMRAAEAERSCHAWTEKVNVEAMRADHIVKNGIPAYRASSIQAATVFRDWAEVAESPGKGEPMENKTRLLLVDDEHDVTQLLRLRLTRRGYVCLAAESGEAALEMLAAEPVHVVIMDVKMPGMGGVAALAHMREGWPQIPVILLSGHADMQTAVTAMESGAFGYLMKPVDFEELLFKIEDASAQIRLEGERQTAC